MEGRSKLRSQSLPDDGRLRTVVMERCPQNRERGEGVQPQSQSLHGALISIPTVMGIGDKGKLGMTG